MLDNAWDLDNLLQEAMRDFQGLAAFIGSEAAFPSVSHDYMWMMLSKAGLPDSWLRVCKAFYHENRHFVDTADGREERAASAAAT